MDIARDDLRGHEIAAFLEEHLRDMRSVSPPESKHALDLEALRKPEITFWTLRMHGRIGGCCALKELGAFHGELKSMRTDTALRRSGVASTLLQHVIREAIQRGYHRLSLETGAMEFFAPARALYQKFGFEPCPPFAAYRDDPNSVFLTRILPGRSTQAATIER